MEECIYQQNGYEDRKDYLNHLSDEYDIPLDYVWNLAELLGENEDFDGLVSMLEDAQYLI